MLTPSIAATAPASAFALISLGGGLYEFRVVDPAWPCRPELIQPARGGVSLQPKFSFTFMTNWPGRLRIIKHVIDYIQLASIPS
jgi:hypothetical protein